MREKWILCVQCGIEFLLSIDEQERLLSRGFDIPKRCPECRRKKTKGVNEKNAHWRLKGKKRQLRDKEIHLA